MSRSRRKRIDLLHHDIPTKANRILHAILIALVLIILRVWHLAVIQYDHRAEESRKPQRKVVIEPATRATIRDRFNLPLAINKIHYQATILYSQIRDIPSIEWEKDSAGKRVKIYRRKEYIKQLSQLLGSELSMDADRIEDLIYAKASYYAQVPYLIQDEVSEAQYYRLKMKEKDWPGIHMRKLPKRIYPKGRVGADIIGYMGSINRQEYEKILSEMKALELFLAEREEGIENELPFGIESVAHGRKRLKDLQEKAYGLHDYVGKTGIEGVYEEQLRGFYGKKNFYSDSKGNYLHELPGSRVPLSGHRVLLTISSELQEYAEQLLAQNEEVRQVRKSSLGANKNTVIAEKHPWIKGGSIIAMEPHSGEVIAMASYPRFDPNDFIAAGQIDEQREKKAKINRWFETETYLAQIWDQQQPFERERYDHLTQGFYDDKQWVTWNGYLNLILPLQSELRLAMNRIDTLEKSIRIQNAVEKLKSLFPDSSIYSVFNALYPDDEPFQDIKKAADRTKFNELFQAKREEIAQIKPQLDPFFQDIWHNYDKVLLVDLSRLAVMAERFSPELMAQMGQHKIEDYRAMTGSLVKLMALIKDMTKELFHDHDFKNWRLKEEKVFLKAKRLEEKAAKTYPKPYLDYFDQQENAMFNEFWQNHRWDLMTAFLKGRLVENEDSPLAPYYIHLGGWFQELKEGAHRAVEWRSSYDLLQKFLKPLSPTLTISYLKTMRSYQELNRPLLGSYRYLRSQKNLLEKHLAAAFYPTYGYGYGRSHAYRQATIQGSLFKLVTAYTALSQRLKKLGNKCLSMHELNPLTMVDEVFQRGNVRYVGYLEDGQPIPQLYKGGRLPRSLAHLHNGKVDLLRALEVSSNPYFSLLAGECIDDPNDLADAARLFSFGSRTGIDLPGEIAGKVPTDLATNRTGLYATAIGQHSLVVTPLQTAVMLAAIANGGKILKPKIVNLTAGRQPTRDNHQILTLRDYPHQSSYSLVGLDFPLFTALSDRGQESLVKPVPTLVKNTIEMPEMVRQILLKGLSAAALKTHQENLSSLTKLYKQRPEAIRNFTELKGQLFGKTSTSEVVENLDLDLEDGTNIYTHVWFGCIAFKNESGKKKKTTFLFKDEFGEPELVVVVYLRYGGYGKEAAPLAAQIVKKWRDIKLKMKDEKKASEEF
jgi:cell division protein FtsI/penicillin-binding protein 2